MRKIFAITILVLSLYAVFSDPIFAQECDPTKTYCLSVPIPTPGKLETQITNPAQYIQVIFRFGIGIGALLAIATIVFAAIKRIASAGNAAQISDANDMILNAIWGLVLLLGSVLILATIDPRLVKLELPGLKPTTVEETKPVETFYSKERERLNKELLSAKNKYLEADRKWDAVDNRIEQEMRNRNLSQPTGGMQVALRETGFEVSQAQFEYQKTRTEIARNDLNEAIDFYGKRAGLGQLTDAEEKRLKDLRTEYNAELSKERELLKTLDEESSAILELKRKFNIKD